MTSALSDLNSRTRDRSKRTGTAGPLPFGGIGNPDQSCRRQPIAIEMGGGSPQMQLPDYPDPLPGEQPHRDGFEQCRLFHQRSIL